MYIQANRKGKSANDLKRVIEKWLDESSGEADAKTVDAELIDPVLMKFVSNNYSIKSDKEWTPRSDEELIPIEGRAQLFSRDEPLYSVGDQKRFLKREFAIAAALEGMDELSVINFVKEFMDPQDVESSGNGESSGERGSDTAVIEINNSVKNAIRKRDPVMLSQMLEDFETQITEINDVVGKLKVLIDETPEFENASEEPNNESSDSEAASKAKFKDGIRTLVAQRDALVQGAKEVKEFLRKNQVTDTATTPGINPGQ
ncbi:hypothetical protein GCM10022212_35080 [Actimicrobium antarcticum]|uniref:Uncharacterized protein n=2 Tax=Actimicrobium antarcticum TaxID=1051899 RepID=A0ABP7TY71_9BURK